jgi:c-di-GMP-related signal transduction protein
LQGTPQIFPKEQVIVEILENIDPIDEVIAALRKLKNKGYRIALDDFVFANKFLPMIELSSIIKFDIIQTPLDTIQDLINDIRSNQKTTLLSEKVETYEEFEKSKGMGFKLFQGYFFQNQKFFLKKESLLIRSPR